MHDLGPDLAQGRIGCHQQTGKEDQGDYKPFERIHAAHDTTCRGTDQDAHGTATAPELIKAR